MKSYKNLKYYRKCSNNFAADCINTLQSIIKNNNFTRTNSNNKGKIFNCSDHSCSKSSLTNKNNIIPKIKEKKITKRKEYTHAYVWNCFLWLKMWVMYRFWDIVLRYCHGNAAFATHFNGKFHLKEIAQYCK